MVRDLRHLLQTTSSEESVLQKPAPVFVPQSHRFRVYSQRGAYRCGMCGKAYTDLQLAWVCVAACGTAGIEKMHIEDFVDGERKAHRCPMCLKVFMNLQDAEICFERCRDQALAHLPAEAMRLAVVAVPGERPEVLRGQDLEALSRERTKKAPHAPIATAAPMAPVSPEAALLELVPLPVGVSLRDLDFASGDTSPLDALAALEGAEAPTGWDSSSEGQSGASADLGLDAFDAASSDEAPPVITRKAGQKPFIREGARYVCTACQVKHFTRNEAESCFESHPLA